MPFPEDVRVMGGLVEILFSYICGGNSVILNGQRRHKQNNVSLSPSYDARTPVGKAKNEEPLDFVYV